MKGTYDGIEITHVLTEEGMAEVIARLNRGGRVAFDLETRTRTHDLKKGDRNKQEWHPGSKVVALSLSWDGDSSTVIPFNHAAAPWYGEAHERLREVAQAMMGCLLIAHNGKFDLRWIHAATGVDLAERLWWDTMLASHVLDETTPNGLKENASPLAPGGVTWGGISMTDLENAEWTPLARYAGFDTAMTWRLFEQQHAELSLKENRNLAKVFRLVSMRASRVLTRAERRGMKADMSRLDAATIAAEKEVDEAVEHLEKVAADLGVVVETKVSYEPTAKYFVGMMNAAVERGLIRGLEKTPQGKWSWRKGVINQLKDEFPLARNLAGYRHGSKQLTYLRAWDAAADEHDRLHGTWRIHGTQTGRLSSANPNMQQVARDLKPIFTAADGYVFVEVDYSQIELRVGAFVSRCKPMIEAFQQGRDLHTMMAAIAAGVDESEVTKDMRQKAKALNFGFIYGMGAEGFVTYARETYGVVVDLFEAEMLRETFFATWYGLEDWHEREMLFAYRNGYILSPLGRRRLLPAAKGGRGYEASAAMRQAINSPVQSMASDIMLLSMDAIDRRWEGSDDLHIVGTVHDSVLMEIRQHCVDTALEEVAAIMKYPDLSLFGISLDVPLGVDATIGTHWADENSIERTYA